MSDFERIELTPAQFQEWLTQSTAQKNALARIAEAIISLKETRLEQRIDHLTQLLEAGVHFPDLGFISAKLDLTLNLLEGDGPSKINDLLTAITQLDRKVDTFMATQEERLQAILVAVKSVKQMLADLKVNNPQIEDEITAIEAELAPAVEPTPEPTPAPAPEG
jgi:hypothetical protein